jgi:site-specific DNA-cytosine methylase
LGSPKQGFDYCEFQLERGSAKKLAEEKLTLLSADILRHAVEIDPIIGGTLEVNHPEAQVFIQDVESYLLDWGMSMECYPFEESRPGHIHASSPCQGFSLLNRNGGKNDKKNNEKCYLWPNSLIEFGPNTGSFENVTGMLQEKHQHYLRTMMTMLLVADYQVRLGGE